MNSEPRRDQSFHKEERIAKRAEFKRIYEQGAKVFGRYVVVFVVPNQGEVSRIGITATKKLGKAHERNRLKRWVRETYRTRRSDCAVDGRRLDLVVNLKGAAARATFAEFSEDLVRSLRKAARLEKQA